MSRKNKKKNSPQELRLTDQQAKAFSLQNKEMFEDEKGRILFSGMVFKNQQESLQGFYQVVKSTHNFNIGDEFLKIWLKKRFRLT
jgi:hypothetical protein